MQSNHQHNQPAYVAVGARDTIGKPSEWPPPVKAYVQKCFGLCKPSQRDSLRASLKLIIDDAVMKGEVYSRAWDKLPVPDVNLKPSDAASVVITFSSVRPVGKPKPMIRQPTMVRFGIDSSDNNRKRSFSALYSKETSGSDVSQGGEYANDEDIRRQQRAGRFKGDDQMYKKSVKSKRRAAYTKAKMAAIIDCQTTMSDEINWDAFALKGTCSKLEKSYFRLTSAPDPSTVRPEPVLRKALARLNGLIASGQVNYFYAQDQFKGMRQDCVVQALRGELATDIYEAHARAALEYGDMAEYNQCQGQLCSLTADGRDMKPEFVAYRILYQTVHGDRVGLLQSLSKLSGDSSNHPSIQHALRVRRALASQNYALFFNLYESAPGLGRALMDLVVPKIRFLALTQFVQAFKPTLSVSFVCTVLGFHRSAQTPAQVPVSGERGEACIPAGCSCAEFEGMFRGEDSMDTATQECVEWLAECKAVLIDSDLLIDCKASNSSQLQLPEEKDAVAHGDANLDIGDFLHNL